LTGDPCPSRGPRCHCSVFEGHAELLDRWLPVWAFCSSRAVCLLLSFSTVSGHALRACRISGWMTGPGCAGAGGLEIGILARQFTNRRATCGQAKHLKVWRSNPGIVRGSERTAQTQLRAYISLESGSIQHANIDGQLGFIVSVVLRNYGVTPGYHFRTWMSPPAILDAEVVPFAAPAVSIADGASSILGPGSQAHLNWRAVFPPDALPEIRDGKKAIFCWGGANYTDAFGHQRHFTFRCATSGGEDTADQGGWGLKPHKIGYDAN